MRTKQKARPKNYSVRSAGVQLDRIEHDIRLVAEQHGDINKKLDSHEAKFDSINKKLDSHTAKLDSHTEMIGGMATDIEIIKSDIEFIKQGFKKKVDVDEFASLERRVAALEKRR